MSNKKEEPRWTKMLDKAGLLDEIEDGWDLPEGPIDGSTIEVKGTQAESEAPRKSEVPFAIPIPSQPPPPPTVEEEELPRTPLEKRSSTPPIEDKTTDPAPPRWKPSDVDIYYSSEGGSSTFDGQPSKIPSVRESSNATAERVITVRGTKISVIPESETQARHSGAIWDEPPRVTDAAPLAPQYREPQPPATPSERNHRVEMRELFDIGDYSGALEIAQQLLKQEPDDGEATEVLNTCRETLIQMYESRIGAFDRVPTMAIGHDEIGHCNQRFPVPQAVAVLEAKKPKVCP